MNIINLVIPNIGNFQDVAIVDVLVKAGDTVEKEQPLLSLESDKATIEIPAPQAGKISAVTVKIGDQVSEGSVIGQIEVADTAPTAAAPSAPVAAPTAAPGGSTKADESCQLLVLGAGPGGYSGAFRAADLGLDTLIVERGSTLGGVCLNVGCIPSKALLHVAKVMDEASEMHECGVSFQSPVIDLDKLRAFKDGVIKKLTTGLSGMSSARKVRTVQGVGKFIDDHHLQVTLTEGGSKIIHFEKAIIAAGSEPVKLSFLPDDPRVVDSTGALELPFIPKRMLVIGGGIIGMEMATVYSSLGAKVSVVELSPGLMPGADRDLVRVYERHNGNRYDIMLETKVVGATATASGIQVTFEGAKAPAESQEYDLVLAAVGRIPNGKKIGAEAAGIVVNERGFIPVDNQMHTNVPHIFAIGDIVGNPMLAHKAVHESHVAAEVAAGEKSYFDAHQIPSVAYTDPEIAWAGITEEQAKANGVKYQKSVFPWAASGRAIANGRDEGFTKLIFEEGTHRLLGGGIVGISAGDLIGEVALAVEMGADAIDIAKTIHPHPTFCESVGLAAEVMEGSCTDLPPQRKK